jgi:tetratricopeptide (TPR) repeat protein
MDSNRNSRNQNIALSVLLLLTFAIYFRTFEFDFVYDDWTIVVSNPHIKSWDYFLQYFTKQQWEGVQGSTATYFRPMFLVWLRLNHAFFGIVPYGWHVMSVMTHLLAVYTAFQLSMKVFKQWMSAWIASMVFALHPTKVEGVAWVTVPDAWMTIFAMGSMIAFLHWKESRANKWMAVSIVSYMCALLFKESTLLLPLLLMFFWMHTSNEEERTWKQAALCALPLWVVASLYLVYRYLALGGFGQPQINLKFTTLVATWPFAICSYIKLMILPLWLSPYYDALYASQIGWENFWKPCLCLMIFLSVSFAVYRWLRSKDDEASFMLKIGPLWIMLFLLPVMSLSSLNEYNYFHDRYLYLPLLGFAWVVAALTEKIPNMQVKIAVVLMLASVLGALSFRQNAAWKSDLDLFQQSVKVAPKSGPASNNLATALVYKGDQEAAIKVYEANMRMNSEYWLCSYNLGLLRERRQEWPEAEKAYLHTVILVPQDPNLWFRMGTAQEKQNKLEEAKKSYMVAFRLNPGNKHYEESYQRLNGLITK